MEPAPFRLQGPAREPLQPEDAATAIGDSGRHVRAWSQWRWRRQKNSQPPRPPPQRRGPREVWFKAIEVDDPPGEGA